MKFGIHPFLYFIKYMYLQSYTVTTFSLILSPTKTNKNWWTGIIHNNPYLKLYSLLMNQRTLGKVIVNSVGEFLSIWRPLHTLYLILSRSRVFAIKFNVIQCQITQIFLPATQIEMQLPQIMTKDMKVQKKLSTSQSSQFVYSFSVNIANAQIIQIFFFFKKNPHLIKNKV